MGLRFQHLDRAVDPGHGPLDDLDRTLPAAVGTGPRVLLLGRRFVRQTTLRQAAENLPQPMTGLLDLIEMGDLPEQASLALLLEFDLRGEGQKFQLLAFEGVVVGIHAKAPSVKKTCPTPSQRRSLTREKTFLLLTFSNWDRGPQKLAWSLLRSSSTHDLDEPRPMS